MGVRVRVRLKVGNKEVVTSALANSGFETDKPEVVLPLKVAEKLSIYPKLPRESVVEEYMGVGGVRVSTFRIDDIVKISVLVPDRIKGPVTATAVITPGEEEVILSDKTLDALGIILIRPGEGLWRYSDDEPTTARGSEPREIW